MTEKKKTGEEYHAVVQKIIHRGHHGSYVVTTIDDRRELGSITFSLKPTVWRETNWPEPGNIVVIGQLNRKRAGWRAAYARFVRPSDDEQTASQERSKP